MQAPREALVGLRIRVVEDALLAAMLAEEMPQALRGEIQAGFGDRLIIRDRDGRRVGTIEER